MPELPLNQVLAGDCREILKTLPDDSFDSLVTDPPAGISFMLRNWDTFKPSSDSKKRLLQTSDDGEPPEGEEAADEEESTQGRAELAAFQDFLAGVMKDVYRVMKPGAYGLVWALPRTSHHTAMALERAGFELKQPILHCFGCLSSDSEILTERGWEQSQTLVEGVLAMCYDVDRGTYSWQPIQKVYHYPYEDIAYRLRGDHTDQIVSRGHRCLVERDGVITVEVAEHLAEERELCIPVLEDVQGLLQALPVPRLRPSASRENLFGGVLGDLPESAFSASVAPTSYLPCMQAGVLPEVTSISAPGQVLFTQVPGHRPSEAARRAGTLEACGQAWASGLDGREPGQRFCQDVWSIESSMEGGSDALLQARRLRFSEVCSMPAGLQGNGSEGWVRRGASADSSSSSWSMSYESGVRSPHQPQPDGQPTGELDAVRHESRSQAVRASRYTRTDLVRIEPIQYSGYVWCVKVPTGAFVARRNGKAFVTGNSGFPKSHNVYKHLLKDPNVPPEVAERWKGYGTALKPAVEVWWLIRKPIDGTIIQNILKHGTGGLNIGDSRVPHANEADLEAHKAQVKAIKEKGGSMGNSWKNSSDLANANDVDERGRWPADLILSHSPDCRDSTCSQDCPVGILSKVEGSDRYFKVFTPDVRVPFFYTGKIKTSERKKGLEAVPFLNNHPTAKASKLMEYLVKLVTPEGGAVLDPFAGSGSTLVAAAELDFNFVGIEQSEDYLPIINERIRVAVEEAEIRRTESDCFALMMEGG
jgi:DNA modification methylase